MRIHPKSVGNLVAALSAIGLLVGVSACSSATTPTTPAPAAATCTEQFVQWAAATYALDEGKADTATMSLVPHDGELPSADCTFGSRAGNTESEVLMVWVSDSVGAFDSLSTDIRTAALNEGYVIATQTSYMHNLLLDTATTTQRHLVIELLGQGSSKLKESGLADAKSALLVRLVDHD
jgi:hypothetical protein